MPSSNSSSTKPWKMPSSLLEVGNAFDRELINWGKLTLSSGSANRALGPNLRCLVDLAPAPAAVEAEEEVVVQPTDERFLTGFIFKIQATILTVHRDESPLSVPGG